MTLRTAEFRARLLTAAAGAGLAIAMLAIAAPAAAQAADGAATPTPDGASADASVDGAQGNSIVVTARRREETLQKTPVAISAFTAETLEAREVHTTQDLERVTPSLQFKPAGQLSGNSASSVVIIRGVG